MGASGKKIPAALQAALAAVLCSAPLLAADKPGMVAVKPGPPAGFELFSAPQETDVDLFYGGQKIGSFRAIYTPKTITFASPEDVVSKIPAVKHEAVARVTEALTGNLPTGAELICGHLAKEGCGKLKPDVAGVIFHEDGFHADLFVNPSLLETQDTHSDKILPPAPDIFSAVHQLNFGVTGSSESSTNYSLLDNSTIAYGPERLNFVGILSNEQNQIDTLTASIDKWGLDNEAGLFNSRQLQLLPETQMAGLSIGTSLKTNLGLRDAAGNTLSVFLPQRSYVSLVYNNVIYSTELYDAGNQVLNTSALPEGAYEVTIRIRDLGGAQTEIKRFFAKNFSIPPRDQPIYFGQVGTVRKTERSGVLGGFGNDLIANGGMIRRLGENSAIDTDFLVIKDTFFTEAGAFLLLPPDHQLRASALASSKGDTGFGMTYLGYFLNQRLSLTSNMRLIFSKHRTSDPIQPIQGSVRDLTSSISYQLTPRASVGFQANYSQSEGAGRQYAFGPNLRYDFWRKGADSLVLTASSDNTDRGLQQSVLLNLTLRSGAWGFNGVGEFARDTGTGTGERGTSEIGDARVTWTDDKDPSHRTIIGAETRHDSASNSYIADLDHRGPYGNLKLIGSQTDSTERNNTFYSGNYGISIAHTNSEAVFGGNQREESGLIVENTGNSSGVPMKVMVDNSQKTTFDTGHSMPLFLPPYETYKVSIKPVQSTSIDYDGTVRNVTLYPGNIVPLVWDINKVEVVVGHVVLPDGTPLTDARLEEARNITVTDSDGLFQGELLALNTITFKRAAEKPPFISDTDDLFTVPPPRQYYPPQKSTMSAEEQRKAILELFGAEEEPAPPGFPKVAPPPEPKKQFAPLPTHRLRPAMRCRVTLPKVKEDNGVYIYPDPLVCTPIPEEKAYGPSLPAPEDQKSPLNTGALTLWEALHQPVSERRINEITEMFVVAANRLPRPKLELPQPLIAQGGPFVDNATHITPEPAPAIVLEKPRPIHIAPPSADTIEVQVGAYRSESQAKEAERRLTRKYRMFEGKTFSIVRADLGEKGIYYRLRVSHFASRREAGSFCEILSDKDQACLLPPATSTNR